MAWSCKLIDRDVTTPAPGDMWYAYYMVQKELIGFCRENLLSDEYFRDWYGKRPPVVVMLPGGFEVLVDGRIPGMGRRGWLVTGEPPRISVTPALYSPHYRGWLQNGTLSEDTDGRGYA